MPYERRRQSSIGAMLLIAALGLAATIGAGFAGWVLFIAVVSQIARRACGA